MKVVKKSEIENEVGVRKTRSDTKVFAKDGKSLHSKYVKGEISRSEYGNIVARKKGYKNDNDYNQKMLHKRGVGSGLTMNENKECAQYLGIHICENEKFISKVISIIESMKSNNPGYDIVCVKNKKIDVKCSCLRKTNMWDFRIKKNKITDYFLCIAFDNRENLKVEHIWLVKGDSFIEKTNHYLSKEFIFNEKGTVNISKGNKALKRWIKHEIIDTYKLEEAQKVCDMFKNDNNINGE